jgi:hypothetical protein
MRIKLSLVSLLATVFIVAMLLSVHPQLLQAQVSPAPGAGSFTGTLTGYASGPTGTIQYRVNPYAHTVTLFTGSAITGTSNATSLTMTGLPFAILPSQTILVPCFATDNATQVAASCNFASGSGTLTVGMGAGFAASGFTNTGTKGLPAGFTVTYPLY